MIEYLKINNLALIESAEVEFDAGFNVISGESGAGKSILLSGIAILCGERCDRSIIRQGCDKCSLAMHISCGAAADELFTLLAESGIDLDEDKTLCVRRVITRTQSRNFINDSPVTQQFLREVMSFLVDRHNANEHMSLIDRRRQLDLLDRYGNLAAEKNRCQMLSRELNRVRRERDEFLSSIPSVLEAQHYLMVAEEIRKVNPLPNEDEELKQRHNLAANAKSILDSSAQAVMALRDSDSSILDQMGEIYRIAAELARISPEMEELLTECGDINDRIRNLAYLFEHATGNVELDQEAFALLEQRISQLQHLKRRYGGTLEAALENLTLAETKAAAYNQAESRRREFAESERNLVTQLGLAAEKLSLSRRKAVKDFVGKVCDKLHNLGFPHARMDISFEQVEPGENGMDKIEFIFSANQGEDLQPLLQIGSSGELSRVMLALKIVLADADLIPVVIFDEIDVNIGGETASRVGIELADLAKRRQIISISHLPQVAAWGTANFAVGKSVEQERTFSHVRELTLPEKIHEIARMLGDAGNENVLKHAAELCKRRLES